LLSLGEERRQGPPSSNPSPAQNPPCLRRAKARSYTVIVVPSNFLNVKPPKFSTYVSF
jgi:hypothetical protein